MVMTGFRPVCSKREPARLGDGIVSASAFEAAAGGQGVRLDKSNITKLWKFFPASLLGTVIEKLDIP